MRSTILNFVQLGFKPDGDLTIIIITSAVL